MVEGDIRAGHLPKRVHAGVGASRAVHGDRRALEARQRVFEQTLDRFALGLSLPADESRAVVASVSLSVQLSRRVRTPRGPGSSTGFESWRTQTREPGLTTAARRAQGQTPAR